MASARKRRPVTVLSETKSMDHLWLGRAGDGAVSWTLAAPLRLLFLIRASPFFTVDALCTLVIDHQAFSLQHDVQPGTPESLPLTRQLTHP